MPRLYVVHVFEPDSDLVLHARADRSHALNGESIAVDIAMTRGNRGVVAQAEALLVAPDGSSRSVSGQQEPQRQPVRPCEVASQHRQHGWPVGTAGVRQRRWRVARRAHGIRGGQSHRAFQGRLRVQHAIVAGGVAGRSRFGRPLRGARNALRLRVRSRAAPLAQAHAAAWFARGDGILVLDFDRSHVPAGYGAPFEVRQLELQDQTRLASLETRERGVRF